jgi:hypothetical protein
VKPRTPAERALVTALRDRDVYAADAHERPAISAELVRALLTHPTELVGRAPSALVLEGLQISGDLRLDGDDIALDAGFERCAFQGDVNLDNSATENLVFADCDLVHLTALDTRVAGNVALFDCRVSEGVSLLGTRIEGQLMLVRSELRAAGDRSVSGSGLSAALGVTISECRIDGTVNLVGADIPGGVHLAQTSIVDPETAVDLQGAKAAGPISVSECTLRGMVNLTYLRTTAGIEVQRTTCSAEIVSLALMGAHIGGDLVIGDDVECFGMAGVSNATVDGMVHVHGADFFGEDGKALTFAGSTIGRTLKLGPGCRFDDHLGLSGLRVGGNVDLDGIEVNAPGNPQAIHLDGSVIQGALMCTDLRCRGTFHSTGVTVEQVQFHHASIDAGRGTALVLDSVTTGGSVYVRGCTLDGGLSLSGADVGGQVSVKQSTLTGRDEEALALVAAQIRSTLLIQPETTIRGHRVSLAQARIGALCSFDGADLEGTLLCNLAGLRVEGSLSLCFAKAPKLIDLSDASAIAYTDLRAQWALVYRLEGFTYQRWRSIGGETARDRLRWLERHVEDFSRQSYAACAAALDGEGRREDARLVLMEQMRRAGRQSGRIGRAWSVALWALVGYGYRPRRAVAWFLGSLVLATVLFAVFHGDHVVQAHPGDRVPGYSSLGYAADVLLPVIDLEQVDAWTATGVARDLFWTFTLWGWILTTALAAAVTAVVVRE